MIDNPKVREIGGYLSTDADGYLINDLHASDIQLNWKPPLDEILDFYIGKLENLHSVYVRGSVAKGCAIDFVSDIDTLAIVESEDPIFGRYVPRFLRQFARPYPNVKGVELAVHTIDEFRNNRTLQILIRTQCICLHGQDLATEVPKLKPGPDTIQHLPILRHEIKDCLAFLRNARSGNEIKRKCGWIMKRVLRGGYELVMERSRSYTRDLHPCFQGFSDYYPEKRDEMYQVLCLAIEPTEDCERAAWKLRQIGLFVADEYERLYPRN